MTEAPPVAPDMYGDTIFCDDIRYEQDGKISYIGVYQGNMMLSGAPPFAIPKFGFSILFSQKKETFDPKVSMKVFLPGDADDKPSIETEVSKEGAMAPPGGDDPEPRFMVMRALLVVSPLIITQEGRIRVRVSRGGVLHRAGALYVRFASPAVTSPSDASQPA